MPKAFVVVVLPGLRPGPGIEPCPIPPRSYPTPSPPPMPAPPPCDCASFAPRPCDCESFAFPFRSSTGWGRYKHRPPPQTGRIKSILRCLHKIFKIPQNGPCAARNATHILTPRPNMPIIHGDSPKYGAICLHILTSSAVSWLRRPTTPNLPRKLAYRPR